MQGHFKCRCLPPVQLHGTNIVPSGTVLGFDHRLSGQHPNRATAKTAHKTRSGTKGH